MVSYRKASATAAALVLALGIASNARAELADINSASAEPARLTDHQMDQVTAGSPHIIVAGLGLAGWYLYDALANKGNRSIEYTAFVMELFGYQNARDVLRQAGVLR